MATDDQAGQGGQPGAGDPAGETDLDELAAPWEDPELESRFSQWKPGDPLK